MSERIKKLAESLTFIAIFNKLTCIGADQYVDKKKNKLTMTQLGYVDTDNFNYKHYYLNSLDTIDELKSEIKALKSERKKLAIQNKELSGKTFLKCRSILDGFLSDKEKVIELKKYLSI